MVLPYNGYHIECLRLGSRKGGAGMGCCAVDVIQNFNHDPEGTVPEGFVGITHGDINTPVMDYDTKKQLGFGPTNLDVFLGYLRTGTFNGTPKQDKTFFAVMTKSQVGSPTGKKWLKILKENGFEFVRAVNNSVYNGGGDIPDPDTPPKADISHTNYIFGLFRNISRAQVLDPFAPPAGWDDIPSPSKADVIARFKTYPTPQPSGDKPAEASKTEAKEAPAAVVAPTPVIG